MMNAVIFDMDGVIVDSEIQWKTLEGYFLQSLIPTWSSSDQDKIIGLGVHDLYTLLIGQYGLQKPGNGKRNLWTKSLAHSRFFRPTNDIEQKQYPRRSGLFLSKKLDQHHAT